MGQPPSKQGLTTTVSLGITNLIEFTGFTFVNSDARSTALLGLKLWQFFWVLSGALLLRTSISLLEMEIDKKLDTFFFLLLVLFLLPIASDHYIAGYTTIGYAITRIEGDFYWALQSITVLVYVFPALILAFGWKRHSSRCRTLFAFCSPMVLVVVIVTILMDMGFQINASVLFSGATTIFILAIYYTESTSSRAVFRLFIPGTVEHTTARRLIRDLVINPISLAEAKNLARNVSVDTALRQTSVKAEAASKLGITPRYLNKIQSERSSNST